VEILSSYPRQVLERAVSPSRGLAAAVPYPNLAKFKKHLDEWADEFYTDQDRLARANRKQISKAPIDPEAKERIAKGLDDLVKHLKSGFGPSTQP
jgi:hypothetical protein